MDKINLIKYIIIGIFSLFILIPNIRYVRYYNKYLK